jgi:hypothetical protein
MMLEIISMIKDSSIENEEINIKVIIEDIELTFAKVNSHMINEY